MAQKNIPVKKPVEVKDTGHTRRQFSYLKPYPNPLRKGMRGHKQGEPDEIEVGFNFSLRIDIVEELECFLDLIEAGKKDIELQLAETRAKLGIKSS